MGAGSQEFSTPPSFRQHLSSRRGLQTPDSGSPKRNWQVWVKSSWQPLEHSLCTTIEKHDLAGDKCFKVKDNKDRTFWIDTEQLTAKDVRTGAQRSLRYVESQSNAGSSPDLFATAPCAGSLMASPPSGALKLPGSTSLGASPLLTRSISMAIARPARFQVYVAHEWKYLPTDLAEEVERHVAAGESVFQIHLRKHRYLVDLNKMQETNLISGVTRRLRRIDQVKTANPTSPSSTLTLSRSLGLTSDGSLAPLRQSLKEYDERRLGMIHEDDLLRVWNQRLCQQQARDGIRPKALDAWSEKLLHEAASYVFGQMRLGVSTAITVAMWVHYWLLAESSPNSSANKLLNEKIHESISTEKDVLQRLLDIFERADTRGTRSLTVHDLLNACRNVKATSAPKSVEFQGACKILEEEIESFGDEVSYYDFCSYMLGRRKEEVQLYCYDLAGGKAPLLSPLLGQYWDGIWHTSIVVYGREYWYGGRLFESVPGSTPFGKPTHVQKLGATLRTKDELWELLTRELAREYTAQNYDVLTHNCNHFTEELSLFLLNESLPARFTQQAEAVMHSFVSKLLRPALNFYLGRCEDGNAATRSADDQRAEAEWNSIGVGSLVTYVQHDGAAPVIAEVLDKRDGVCDLRWIDGANVEFVDGTGATKAQVKPTGQSTGRRLPAPVAPSPMALEGAARFGGMSCLLCPTY